MDDGTPRIVQLSPSLCLVHTGVGADGRALSEIAIKLVLDHRYVYGEEMGVQDLLAGLSSKMQEMTMQMGSRPYGCALLVCCLGEVGRNSMYRVDPSGAVVSISSLDDVSDFNTDGEEGSETAIHSTKRRRSVTLLGNWENLKQKKELVQQQLEKHSVENEEQILQLLVDAARQTLVNETVQDIQSTSSVPILFASFSHQRGLEIKRITNS